MSTSGSLGHFYETGLQNAKLSLYSIQDPSSPRTVDFQYLFQTNQFIGFYFLDQTASACRAFTKQLRDLQSNLKAETPTNEKQKRPFGSPAKIRRFFNGKSKNKNNPQQQQNLPVPGCSAAESFEIIAVSLDQDELSYRRTLSDTLGWWMLPFSSQILKNRLIRVLKVQSGPSLVVVDCVTKKIVTRDGRRAMQGDPEGTNFPWWPPSFKDVFTGTVLSNKNLTSSTSETVDLQCVAGKKKGILFSANWCPPCRSFVRQLIQTYKKILSKSTNGELEIIFCSSDRSAESFKQHFSQMPWLAFPFGDERIDMITKLLDVNGIPALFILDENNDVITRHGKNEVLADPEGECFPWYPKALVELTEFSVPLLREEISVVLFTEGSEDDAVFAQGVMGNMAESELTKRRSPSSESLHSNKEVNGNEKPHSVTNGREAPDHDSSSFYLDPLQFFFTGEDPVCDQVLDSLGLQEAPLPLICILDVLGEALYICEHPDVSEDVIKSFVDEYRRGLVQPRRISQTELGRLCGVAHVGGIPLNAISAALGMSPQNSMAQSVIIGPDSEERKPS